MAKKHRILLPVLALLLIGACSRNEEIEQPTSPSGGVEVAILCDNTKEPQVYSLPDGTRTWIDDNDWASTRWDKNDKIALWATADALPLFEQSNQMLETPPSHALRFRHKCHALRIEVPAGRNIWGEPITRLVIDFPTEVVGTV